VHAVTRRSAVALAVAAVLVAGGGAYAAVRPGRTEPVAWGLQGGASGVTDAGTGKLLEPRRDEHGSGPSWYDVPYQEGRRLTLGTSLVPSRPVEILAVTLASDDPAVRQDGVLVSDEPYTLDRSHPFAPFRIDPLHGWGYVGIDVSLCCAGGRLPGWYVVLQGVRVRYREHGRVRTAYQPFGTDYRLVVHG
jgi:hypothetical protein